jgi:hypothetical protein
MYYHRGLQEEVYRSWATGRRGPGHRIGVHPYFRVLGLRHYNPENLQGSGSGSTGLRVRAPSAPKVLGGGRVQGSGIFSPKFRHFNPTNLQGSGSGSGYRIIPSPELQAPSPCPPVPPSPSSDVNHGGVEAWEAVTVESACVGVGQGCSLRGPCGPTSPPPPHRHPGLRVVGPRTLEPLP